MTRTRTLAGSLMDDRQSSAGPDQRDAEPPATQTVRLDAELVRKARAICALRAGRNGRMLKVSEYLDPVVRATIERDFESVVRELAARNGSPSPEGDGEPSTEADGQLAPSS